MSKVEMFKRLSKAVVEGDAESAKRAANDVVRSGIDAYEAIIKGCAKGMSVVGDKFEKKECFLPEVLLSAEAMESAVSILKPHIKGEITASGKVVIGVVEGDVHSIGKNLVTTLLQDAGFQVHDLGTNVPTSEFVKAAMMVKPDILALSTLMTPTIANVVRTIKTLEDAGLRDNFKIMAGGAAITEEYATRIGADAWAYDASKAVKVAKKLVKELKSKAP